MHNYVYTVYAYVHANNSTLLVYIFTGVAHAHTIVRHLSQKTIHYLDKVN